ncbi:MAG: CDP-diacylglycerol--glycerol-3-phosphate 3-phosphatidyltransferase [Bacilli bacterium]|nr:CDP-diacylglycerol--glycerol-3-phosphate 3-phosphatidyltransferase [Bacilli bacterium]
MNLANKITISRMAITALIIIILLFPFESAGINFTNLFINELIVVNAKYIIVGILFVIALITDYLDGYVARKKDMVTELGDTLDYIADKLLIDSVLIILSSQGFLHPFIPVIIIGRDYVANAIRMTALKKNITLKSVKIDKYKNIIIKIGVALTLFYNLPFELFNLNISDILLIVGTVLSVISCIQYYNDNRRKIIKA